MLSVGSLELTMSCAMLDLLESKSLTERVEELIGELCGIVGPKAGICLAYMVHEGLLLLSSAMRLQIVRD